MWCHTMTSDVITWHHMTSYDTRCHSMISHDIWCQEWYWYICFWNQHKNTDYLRLILTNPDILENNLFVHPFFNEISCCHQSYSLCYLHNLLVGFFSIKKSHIMVPNLLAALLLYLLLSNEQRKYLIVRKQNYCCYFEEQIISRRVSTSGEMKISEFCLSDNAWEYL